MEPGLQCRTAIRAAERAAGVPEHLMSAIGIVESGRPGPNGVVNPWPWSINAEGQGFIFENKQQAVVGVQALQAKGIRSIDVGCMQVNLMYHPTAFASLDSAFDPTENARYAARFLVLLKAQTGAWEKATAWYHSGNPELGEPYQRKVAALLPEEKKRREDIVQAGLAAAWGATMRPVQTGGTTPAGLALARGATMRPGQTGGTTPAGLALAWGATMRPVSADGTPVGRARPKPARVEGMFMVASRSDAGRIVLTAYRDGAKQPATRQGRRAPL
jgi:hypothetical protein